LVTSISLALSTPGPYLVDAIWRCEAKDFQDEMIVIHSWLLFLTLSTVVVACACLKYCATNRDARWSLLSLLGLISVWVTWGALTRILDVRFREPVTVMGLVVSGILLLLCVYARKLYEFSEFGKVDTKLELMSNILLSESPTSQPSTDTGRSYSNNAVLPGIIAMPEFEDNSILGESIYHAVEFQGRDMASGPVNMKMFETEPEDSSDDHEFETNSGFDTDTVRSHTREMDMSMTSERDVEGSESIYHTISRGVSYKPVLKKIGSRKMLVLPDQHTLTHGSTTQI